MRKGRRMKPSVAPTSRMIEISRLRASTAMRIVAPMMMIADGGERQAEREAGHAGDVAQAVELRDPLLAEPHVVDERRSRACGRRPCAPSPDRESPA